MALNQIQTIVADQLNLVSSTNLKRNTKLDVIILDAMDANDIYIALEDIYDIEFSEDAINSFETLGDIADYIEAFE